MADSQEATLRRFSSAAPYYLSGRIAYAPRLVALVAQLTGLDRTHRVLDLGCGPGMLAGAFAPTAAEVVAMDPEPEMLRVARTAFGMAANIRFAEGSSADLPGGVGRIRLVTMGRSFHWMDRAETLRRLDAMIEPGGAVALFDADHRDVPENAWLADYRTLVRGYALDDGRPAHRAGGVWVRHEAMLLGSAFSVVDDIGVIERRQVTVRQMIDRALSHSSMAPARLGEAAAGRLAAEIAALLTPIARDGCLTEVVETSALLARRPGEVG